MPHNTVRLHGLLQGQFSFFSLPYTSPIPVFSPMRTQHFVRHLLKADVASCFAHIGFLQGLDNIRMDLVEMGWGYLDWIGLPQDMDRWRALVDWVLNLRFL
jgi:hypothetical protein